MTPLLLFLALALTPIQQTTAHCYALHEPNKHGETYLRLTDELGCTMNWYTAPLYLDNDGHWPTIWNAHYRPTVTQLAAWAAQYPDRWWMLFNEPERIDQANTSPFDAAIHARYWTEAIGENGQTACCGVLVNPRWGGWRDWLQMYLLAGGPVPDAWHIHIYAATPAEFDATLALWDAWNAEKGGNLPTIISETGSGPEVYGRWLAFDRADVPAVFWFGLPPEPEASATSGDVVMYFPMVRGDR